VIGWREVPVDTEVCGEIALATLPRIEQLFIDGGELSPGSPGHGPVRSPSRAEIACDCDPDFYICSLSAG
jgi:glutamate synthase (NADPH/NADH) large chain